MSPPRVPRRKGTSVHRPRSEPMAVNDMLVVTGHTRSGYPAAALTPAANAAHVPGAFLRGEPEGGDRRPAAGGRHHRRGNRERPRGTGPGPTIRVSRRPSSVATLRSCRPCRKGARTADMLGKSIVGRSAWTRPEPDVLYGLMRAETVSRIGRPLRESSPGGVYTGRFCAGMVLHLQGFR